jgi:hypothetical protein
MYALFQRGPIFVSNFNATHYASTLFHMKNKGLLLLLGYLLFTLGITSVIMELVGTHWYFMAWLEHFGALFTFILKILMMIGGILLIVLARVDWEREKRESSE